MANEAVQPAFDFDAVPESSEVVEARTLIAQLAAIDGLSVQDARFLRAWQAGIERQGVRIGKYRLEGLRRAVGWYEEGQSNQQNGEMSIEDETQS
jgi:hypothetical protein